MEVLKAGENLDLLMGSDKVSRIEHRMATASSLLQGDIGRNFVSDFTALDRLITYCRSCRYDYVLIDLAPAYNTMCRNVLCLSDYWIISCMPDEFTIQSLDTVLSRVAGNELDEQYILAEHEQTRGFLHRLGYEMAPARVKILGFILNRVTITTRRDAQPNQLTDIQEEAVDELIATFERHIPTIRDVLPFKITGLNREELRATLREHLRLAQFTNFASANTISQQSGIPAGYLTHDYCRTKENYNSNLTESFKEWKRQYERLVDIIVKLPSNQ